MKWNELAELICAVISLLVTAIIGLKQYCQSRRMEEFERRQDERDERRHAEGNRTKAVEFISRYYSDRGLIPLCAVAAMHNDLFYYSREMYRSFCCLTPEVQNLILEYCNLDLRVRKENDLFNRCIAAIENALRDRFPKDETAFYDDGKYVLRSLDRYAGEKFRSCELAIFQSVWTHSVRSQIAVPPSTTSSSLKFCLGLLSRRTIPSLLYPV